MLRENTAKTTVAGELLAVFYTTFSHTEYARRGQ